jgi:hypothetical protein
MLFVYLLPDKLAAPGATNRMIVMFCYNRLYRRYLHLLPALITATDGDIRWDIYPAMSTQFGSMVFSVLNSAFSASSLSTRLTRLK